MSVRRMSVHDMCSIRSIYMGLLAAATLLLLTGSSEARAAATPTSIEGLPLVDSFATSENPLSGAGTWTQLGTASHPGRVVASAGSGGWGPSQAFPAVNGAFWNGSSFATGDDGAGVAATLSESPSLTDRYFSLWLDMAEPDGPTSAGYELRFTQTATASFYDIALLRWQAGTSTILASVTGYPFPQQSSFALADEGGMVSAWTNTGSGYSMLLSASDATFDGGYAGIAGAGNITRIRQFRAGALDGSLGSPVSPSAALKAHYPLQGDRISVTGNAAPLADIGIGNHFAVETVDGVARQVMTFPRGGGLSLNTTDLVRPSDYSVAMLFRLDDTSSYRRLLDFTKGTSDTGLYNLDRRAVLYPSAVEGQVAVFNETYAHLVLTSAAAPGGLNDTSVYVNGALAVAARTSAGFGLGSGELRFFKDDTSVSGEESAGAVACISAYDGTLTPSQVAQLAGQPSRCEPLSHSPDPDPVHDPLPGSNPAPGSRPDTGSGSARDRVKASARRKPRARRWRGSIVVDTGLTVTCSAADGPCAVSGRVGMAPAFKWMSVGSIKLSLPMGAKRNVVVRLSRRGRSALRNAGRLKIKVSAAITTPGGTRATARQRGTIVAPADKRSRRPSRS